MSNKDKYLAMMEEGYIEICEDGNYPPMSRLTYLSDFIFHFNLYDDDMEELFAKKAIEVCEVISKDTAFGYIKDEENYKWYLIMCNFPFFAERIGWSSSIRGASWDIPFRQEKMEFSSCGLFKDHEQIDDLEFTLDEWKEFIGAVIEFGKREEK